MLASGNVCALQSFVHRGSGVNHSGQSNYNRARYPSGRVCVSHVLDRQLLHG